MIPEARAITPQEQTVKITDTHDDAFITEVGIGIDSSLVTIKDPGMDIRAYLVFRELDINYWEPLENATLRLHTSTTLSFDADSSVTIYGMKLSDLQLEGFLIPSTVLNIGYTNAHTDYNTSEFYGSQWHEIDVTDIVEELIRNPNWDGDGSAGTETGDAIGFHIFGAEGDEKRYFYDLKVGNGLEAQLVIHWNHEPPPPSGPGTPTFNETYRGYHIFVVNYLSRNRTGEGFDVNWNLLNVTKLQEHDVTGSINPQNDTWVFASSLSKAEMGSLYNDTGVADIYSFFVRFKVNVTDVYTTSDGDDVIPGYCSISSLEPIGINGLLAGDAGEWAGLASQVEKNDELYRFFMREHKGTSEWLGQESRSQWFSDQAGDMIYVEFMVDCSGDTNWMSYELFDDPGFKNRIYYYFRLMEKATGPFRYPQMMASIGFAGTAYNTFHQYTYLESPLVENTTWSIVDENGTTVVIGLDEYDDALIFVDDLLGADPEDPDPPGEEWDDTGPFTRFKTRLYFLILGLTLFFGPMFFFAYQRPSGYQFVIGLFIMFVGIAFLISVGSV